ncbi:hypothetical protein QTP86_025095 [Hemibagrus guttatus]|nr:hypothetical protein QTP86_025095 [Hemibagrus guttatus]
MGSQIPIQNFMNEIFWDMLHRFVIIYIDDILIYSSNLSDHADHVQQVLNRLRQYHFEMVQPPRQAANPLTPRGKVLMAQHGPGRCQIREGMLSLCHDLNSMSSA